MTRTSVIIFLLGLVVLVACTNSGSAGVTIANNPNYPGSASAGSGIPISFQGTLSAYPNKKFSAYVFQNNALVAVVRSNAMTDGAGNINVKAVTVDANNCATTTTATTSGTGVYAIHIRIDGNGTSGFVYPTGCPNDYGFLSTASVGYWDYRSPGSYAFPYSIYYVGPTYQASYTFYTSLGTVSRQVYCSVLDEQILNPTIFTSSTLGYAQGTVSFSGGYGTATSTMTFASASFSAYKYACWIDANNSGTYNSGDLIATGAGSGATISNWTTVP